MRSQIGFDADIKDKDNRQGSKYKRYRGLSDFSCFFANLLGFVLPPSLLGHESARGCQP